MATQLVPDGIEVVMTAVQNGVPIVNIFNIKDTATHDSALLSEYCDEFLAWWRVQLKPVLSNSYVLSEIKATSLETGTGPQHILSPTVDNQGELTGEEVAGNAAVVISWRTASIGRSFRGRTYIGGLDAAATVTAQAISAPFAVAIAGAATDLIDRITALGGTLCVLSRYLAGTLRVVGLLTEIISVIVDTKIDSQRRRTAN